MDATTQNQLTALRSQLAAAERRLENARPRDVAGEPIGRSRESAQRNVDRLRASIARVEARA